MVSEYKCCKNINAAPPVTPDSAALVWAGPVQYDCWSH